MDECNIILAVMLLFSAASIEAADVTMESGATGTSVVDATVLRIQSSCIFSEDKLLMRRIAFVESRDGADPKTFRAGYFGGIWQVDEAMFVRTKASDDVTTLQSYLDDILTKFQIEWNSIEWKDLTKPLHSALAARLYIEYAIRNEASQTIPRPILDQANFWKSFYRPSGIASHFVNQVTNFLKQECPSNNADIFFVVDSSGSVGLPNYMKIKDFLKSVVLSLGVGSGSNRYQIGILQYSYVAHMEFLFNEYKNLADILSAIDRIGYMGSDTPTDKGIDMMIDLGFNESNGARPISMGYPRIGIVVTDGVSNDPVKTAAAAARARAAQITMIVVGIGNLVDMNELETIASVPVCLDLIVLQSFSEVESLKYVIEKRACTAPVVISPNTTLPVQLFVGGVIIYVISFPPGGATLKVKTSEGGNSTFYFAISTYPSPSYFDHSIESSLGHIGAFRLLYNESIDGVVFGTLKGDDKVNGDVILKLTTGDDSVCSSNPCQNGGTCSLTDFTVYHCTCLKGYSGTYCQTSACSSNPCQNGGTCVVESNGYSCTCSADHTGVNCQIVSGCTSNSCKNGGICTAVGTTGFKCTCTTGFSGPDCNAASDTLSPTGCSAASWAPGFPVDDCLINCCHNLDTCYASCDNWNNKDNCDLQVKTCIESCGRNMNTLQKGFYNAAASTYYWGVHMGGMNYFLEAQNKCRQCKD